MKLKNKVGTVFLALVIAYSSYTNSISSWRERINWLKSAVSFHLSLIYNNYFGQGVCSFHNMLAPHKEFPEAHIVIGPEKTILLIADGLEAPLYLGNLPQSPDHFITLRIQAGLPNNIAMIGLHTLNRGFEQWLVNLEKTIKKDGNIRQYHYSTTDYTAPSLIDLIRGIYNLKERDYNHEMLAYVHCKAGKGRSATLVVAYLLYVYSIAQKVNPDGSPYKGAAFTDDELINALITYIHKQRYLVNMNHDQKKALQELQRELKKYGSFDKLYDHYKKEIKKRDAEFIAKGLL